MDYVTSSEVKKLIEDNIKTAVELATRHEVMEIEEETIGNEFMVGYVKYNEGTKPRIRNKVEGAMLDIIKKDGWDTILVQNVDELAKSSRFMDALTQWFLENTSFIMPISAAGKHLDRILGEVSSKKASEQQLTEQEMMQISRSRSSPSSPIFEPLILTPQEQSLPSESNEEKNKMGEKSEERKTRKIASQERN